MACKPEDIDNLVGLLTGGGAGGIDVVEVTPIGPTPTTPGVAFARKKTGWLGFIRPTRFALGDEFGVQVADPTFRYATWLENQKLKAYDEAYQIIKPLLPSGIAGRLKMFISGIPRDVDTKLLDTLKQTDITGRFTGTPGSFPPEYIDAAKQLRGLYNKYGKLFDVDPDIWINHYWPIVAQRGSGVFHTPDTWPEKENLLARLHDPRQRIFYHELERRGKLMNPDPTFSAGFMSYVDGGYDSKFMKPFLEQIETTKVDPFFELSLIRRGYMKGKTVGVEQVDASGDLFLRDVRLPGKANFQLTVNDAAGYRLWLDMKNRLAGSPTNLDIIVTNSLNNLLKNYGGYQADTRALYQIAQATTSLGYSGALGSPIGGRPGTVLRQLMQTVPIYAQLGAKSTMQGVTRAMNPENLVRWRELGVITSPLENLIRQVDVAQGAGRAISSISAASLRLFSALDQKLRATAAGASEALFEDFKARGIALSKLPGRKEIREEIGRLVAQGKEQDALIAYMFENANNTQYLYGRAARPQVLGGAVGNLINMFVTFPLNTLEMFRMFGKQAVEGDPRPILRLLLAEAAIMYLGSEYLNADMWNWTLLQGAMPHSLPLPKLAKDVTIAGKESLRYVVGNVYKTGETDFQEFQREQAYREVGRGLSLFIPGGLFALNEVPDLIETKNLSRVFGFKPKAVEVQEEAREKTRQKAREKRLESGISATGAIR